MAEQILLSPAYNQYSLAPGRIFHSPLGFGDIKVDRKLGCVWINFVEAGVYGPVETDRLVDLDDMRVAVAEDSLVKGIINREMTHQIKEKGIQPEWQM